MSRKQISRKHKTEVKLAIADNAVPSKLKAVLLPFLLVIILAGIPFSMGKYIEFNSPGAFDSGAYVYSAKHILDGAKLGIDEKPSAQMGTLLVNILGVWLFGFNEVGPEIIQTLLQASALILMFIAMQQLFGKLPAAVGVIIASTYLSAPLIAKFGNVKEQYMIAFMILGISSLVLRQLGGKWYWCLLAGAFVSWAPLFKQTGVSAIGAMGLFVIIQPIFRNRSWKQTAIDIALLLAGAACAIVPICLWLWIIESPANYFPYHFAWKILFSSDSNPIGGSYISKGRQLSSLAEQAGRVLRYYSLLILPIALAIASIVVRIVRLFAGWLSKSESKANVNPAYNRFVLLFAIWWILDMAFVWISPRSYEQYYLPLNASAAMLGGYVIAVYKDKLTNTKNKAKWFALGTLGLLLMIIMSWHIFVGISISPHSGTKYPQKRRGYLPRIAEINKIKANAYLYPWEQAGLYIREHSMPDDKIFVWGWVPGIYVKAQRLSPTVKPFTSEMHVKSPTALVEYLAELLVDLKAERPKFIVDTHKRHFPWNRPPLELWPTMQKGLLPNNGKAITGYEAQYTKMLKEKVGEDEAERFETMKPFRDFVMKNYKPAKIIGPQIIFELY